VEEGKRNFGQGLVDSVVLCFTTPISYREPFREREMSGLEYRGSVTMWIIECDKTKGKLEKMGKYRKMGSPALLFFLCLKSEDEEAIVHGAV